MRDVIKPLYLKTASPIEEVSKPKQQKKEKKVVVQPKKKEPKKEVPITQLFAAQEAPKKVLSLDEIIALEKVHSKKSDKRTKKKK